jgi:hypothetical protein
MKMNKYLLIFALLIYTCSSSTGQINIERKFDNKALPVYKLEKYNLLEFLDIFMKHSLDQKDIEFLIKQQKIYKDYPLGYIYALDCLSRFPIKSKSIFKLENEEQSLYNADFFVRGGNSKSVTYSDFKKIEGQYNGKYYDSIRNRLDTILLKKIKVILNDYGTTELDDTFKNKEISDHLAEAYILSYQKFSNFVKHNPVSSIQITLQLTEKHHEEYLKSVSFLSFIKNQIKSDLLWIMVNNKWRWVNYWK